VAGLGRRRIVIVRTRRSGQSIRRPERAQKPCRNRIHGHAILRQKLLCRGLISERWFGGERLLPDNELLLFKSSEIKGLVLPDRTAEGKPVMLIPQFAVL